MWGHKNTHRHEYLKSSYLKFKSEEISVSPVREVRRRWLRVGGVASISSFFFFLFYISISFYLDFSEECHTRRGLSQEAIEEKLEKCLAAGRCIVRRKMRWNQEDLGEDSCQAGRDLRQVSLDATQEQVFLCPKKDLKVKRATNKRIRRLADSLEMKWLYI